MANIICTKDSVITTAVVEQCVGQNDSQCYLICCLSTLRRTIDNDSEVVCSE